MTIATVTVVDAANPVEIQDWLDAHPHVVFQFMWSQNNIFYILYME